MASDPAPGPAMFSGGDDVAADLAAVDWASTPLGPPADWPQSLRTTVNILLSSRFSMFIAWGPDLTFFCNDAYRRNTLGRKYPWALGRPFKVVWEEVWADVGPRIERVLATGESTWDEGLLLFLERSGYAEETYHTFSYSPLHDDDGAVVGILCVVSEDTARVIGERRMATLRDLGSDPTVVRTEEEMLEFTTRQLERNQRDLPFTLTYLFDSAGVARLAASSGISAGHPAAPPTLPIDGSVLWPIGEVAEGRSVTVDLRDAAFGELPRGSWSEPPVSAMVTPLVAQGSTPIGFLVAGLNRYRPLTEDYRGFLGLVAAHISGGVISARSYAAQQHRAEQLAELDRAKTMFFSNISHEFRTPLTLILGPIAELRLRAGEFDEHTRNDFDVVYRNGLRLTKLVNNLLDFSRIEAGRIQTRYEPVDLGTVTAELASVFRSAIERAGLELRVDCPPHPPDAYIDRDMWEKVVFNLLSNALKFTLHGSISVAVRRDGNTAAVTVSDTGIGIPEMEMPRLFERFHRVQTSAARSTEGSGIGLALVRELVGLQGGTITADSVEGVGTTFTIRMPLGVEHLPADADISTESTAAPAAESGETYVQEALRWTAPDATRDTAPGTPPARVLVADDNSDMREYLSGLLRGAGYQVQAVADGRQALDAIRTDLPDLVISDVMMPHLDGLALVAALRGDARTAQVPVVLLSARAGQEASIEGFQAGADDYLVKPFSSAEMLARVATNIALARLRNRQIRWHAAMVESLQEAFFVCRGDGAMIEFNQRFSDMVGYGLAGLPYYPPYPWWPDAVAYADDYRRIHDAFYDAMNADLDPTPFLIQHRDGHLLWVDITSTRTEDPLTGEFVTVGTFRDVTEEHYRAQRQAALATVNEHLAQAGSLPEAVGTATQHLAQLFDATRVLAATFADDAPADSPAAAPDLVCTGQDARWPDLADATRQRILALAQRHDALVPDTDTPGAAGISLQLPDGVLALWIELRHQRILMPEEQTLLTVLASRLTQGLHRVHEIDQQRETALALQHAILGPAELPAGFAARYQPATQPLEVGGDWFDVATLDDGRIAMVVGDCVGHGLSAASVMGQLRSACRALLLQRLDPAQTLAGLDRFAAGLAGARCTTACAAVLDPATGELCYSVAGHPPPIMVHPDGTSVWLDGARSLPLGVREGLSRPVARVTLQPGATVLLYTDGLVERHSVSLDSGITRAADVVIRERDHGIEQVADALMTSLAPDGGYHDDVAILLYRRAAPLVVRFPARPTELAPARKALREWLATIGADPQLTADVLLAAGEAVGNAVEHGHRDSAGGMITLRTEAVGRTLQLSVVDSGQWKDPEPDPSHRRGRGLALIHALMDDVRVERSNAGTTVRMSVSLD